MAVLLLTVVLTLGAFALFGIALGLGRLFGRVRPRRCACVEANAVMKRVEDRRKARRAAARYRSENVDPGDLPILPSTLLDESRRPR